MCFKRKSRRWAHIRGLRIVRENIWYLNHKRGRLNNTPRPHRRHCFPSAHSRFYLYNLCLPHIYQFRMVGLNSENQEYSGSRRGSAAMRSPLNFCLTEQHHAYIFSFSIPYYSIYKLLLQARALYVYFIDKALTLLLSLSSFSHSLASPLHSYNLSSHPFLSASLICRFALLNNGLFLVLLSLAPFSLLNRSSLGIISIWYANMTAIEGTRLPGNFTLCEDLPGEILASSLPVVSTCLRF